MPLAANAAGDHVSGHSHRTAQSTAASPSVDPCTVCDNRPVERTLPIDIPYDAIAAFCRRNHIARLSLFGSVLRDDFTDESDIDVLVEFETGATPGLAFFRMEEELESILGRKVDLNTPRWVNRRYRDRVLAEAESIYDAA
jgi:predicted nucleotidyltransferase